MWVVAVIINGLTLVTIEPFHSEEACRLAAKTAHIGECLEVEPKEAASDQ